MNHDPEYVRRRQRLAEAMVEDDLPPKRRKVTTDQHGRRSELVFRSDAELHELELASEVARKKSRTGRIDTHLLNG